VSLAWHCDPGVIVSGDAGWIERIVLNLVDNALKFTASGGHVSVRVSKNGTGRTLEVSDDGMGIPPDSLPHIFERFYRADPSRANRADGVGLGLSLVKWAVDQHHGAINIESRPGKGSTFRVSFPVD
jgi:two-component system phosphate regulon sensor histidine kinase PhoR